MSFEYLVIAIAVGPTMLTCEICGEQILLEEDMKTHLLLSHLENDLHCPLCFLSGVSYDELCFHISVAHPEEQQDLTHFKSTSSCSAGTDTNLTESEKPQSAPKLFMSYFCTAGEAIPSGASCVTADSVQSSTPESKGSSPGKSAPLISTLTTQSPKIKHKSVKYCDEENNGITFELKKAKQNQPSSQQKDELLSCPKCTLICSSNFILQEHMGLHLQEQLSAKGEKRLECPICSVICLDSNSLQEHVELHLDHCAALNSTESLGSDLKLARRLQQEVEEEQRRRLGKAKKEKEEFIKLQSQFGLDGRGGYFRQMERTMEKAVARGLMAPLEFHSKRARIMESLASGVDDGITRTHGVVRALYEYYRTECRDGAHVWLSAETDHYSSSAGDKGWGCGYRNFQMLLSSLHRIDIYASLLQERAMPNIPHVQRMIEGAWKEGVDPQGASHFNQRLHGTTAWIGATEIFTLLTYLGISSRIIDFHQPTGPGDTHPRLFDWVRQYFCQSSSGSRLTPRLVLTSLPPLYLQHQGHSRSIVGFEQKKNGSVCLLLLDPGSSLSDTRKLLNRDTVSTAVCHIRKFSGSMTHTQYQVVVVQGVLSAEEKQKCITKSRILRTERIP